MDPDVDKHYKQKYFPTTTTSSTTRRPIEESRTQYSPKSSHDPDLIENIIDSLPTISILQIEPEDPEKPCYLANIPDELLLNIVCHLSFDSLSSLSQISQVCKKLFFLSQGESSLYKALCMHYFRWYDSVSTLHLRVLEYNNNWRRMLIERPRLRFDGVYISRCHYYRSGVSDYSWNAPIHMVMYFRFLRFYPDGNVICVLTSLEPKEVVHSVKWDAYLGLKGVSLGIWRMSEVGGVTVEVRGIKGYTFFKELQVIYSTL